MVRYIEDEGLVIARCYDDSVAAIGDLLGQDLSDLTVDQAVRRLVSEQRRVEKTIVELLKTPIRRRTIDEQDNLDIAVSWLHEALGIIAEYNLDVSKP